MEKFIAFRVVSVVNLTVVLSPNPIKASRSIFVAFACRSVLLATPLSEKFQPYLGLAVKTLKLIKRNFCTGMHATT